MQLSTRARILLFSLIAKYMKIDVLLQLEIMELAFQRKSKSICLSLFLGPTTLEVYREQAQG